MEKNGKLRELELSLTWRSLAKIFFEKPRVKVSLHLRLIVDGYSFYKTLFNESFNFQGIMTYIFVYVHLCFSIRERAMHIFENKNVF